MNGDKERITILDFLWRYAASVSLIGEIFIFQYDEDAKYFSEKEDYGETEPIAVLFSGTNMSRQQLKSIYTEDFLNAKISCIYSVRKDTYAIGLEED